MCEGCATVALIFGSAFLVFGIIGGACMGSYAVNRDKNTQLVPATCLAQTYSIVARTCFTTCNCDSKGANCHSCPYTCFDAYVVTDIADVVTGRAVLILNLRSAADALAYMQINYPLAKTYPCYYSGSAATADVDIRLFTYDSNSSFVAGLVFLGLACVVLLVWLIVACVIFLPVVLSNIGDSILHKRRDQAAVAAASQRAFEVSAQHIKDDEASLKIAAEFPPKNIKAV
jgi:hypothetical protein